VQARLTLRAAALAAGALSAVPDFADTAFATNENDALLTPIDIKTRPVVMQFPVGVEPEGVAVSPDGAMVINTSETTSMAHLIDWSAKKIVAQHSRPSPSALRRIQA
jgi:DNA-binding beta-propeller fold protein YncE